MSNFYIVATPIGNLEDITLRAIRILKEVDLILCENTSNAQKLLKYYEIKTPTNVYFSKSKLSQTQKILEFLESGKNIALISDAGTPGISDPGSLLINKIKNKFNDKIKIIPIPGPSAIIALFSVSGIFGNEFSFLGFAPHKKGRETFIKNLFFEIEKRPIIFYESVHRIIKLLKQMLLLEKDFENKNIKIIIGRELTKIYEEIISGSILEVLEYFENNKEKIKGEFTILIYKENYHLKK